MKQTLYFALIGGALTALISGSALAAKVAVVSSMYFDVTAGESVSDAAQKVDGQVMQGAVDAGFEVVSGAEVAAAVEAESTGDGCDAACMKRVKDALQVDEVVFTRVEDTDQMDFATTVSFAVHKPLSDKRTAGFFVVLEWVKGAVALALKETVEEPATVVQPETAPETDSAKQPEKTVVIDAETLAKRKKISPVPLFVAGGVTVALGAATLVLNGIAHRKYTTTNNDISESGKTSDQLAADIDSVDNLQLAVKISLIATGAGLLTTGVLAFFTDFGQIGNSKKKEQTRVAPALVLGPQMGAVSLRGTF